MPESFALVRLLNDLFMGVEVKAFQSIGLIPAEAAQQAVKVNQAFGLELLVAAGLIAFFLIVRLTLAVEKPNPAQQIAEMIHEFTGGQADQIIGHGYQRFQAFVTCIFLFVVINNLLGLIPGLETPTSSAVGAAGHCGAHLSLLQLSRHPRAGSRRAISSSLRVRSGGLRR